MSCVVAFMAVVALVSGACPAAGTWRGVAETGVSVPLGCDCVEPVVTPVVDPVLIVGPEPASLLDTTICSALISSVHVPARLSSEANTRIQLTVEISNAVFIAAPSSTWILFESFLF